MRTVAIGDDDSGAAMFNALTNLNPDDTPPLAASL